MALSSFVGTLNCPASTGNAATTGLGFQPEALIFFGTLLTADGTGAHAAQYLGFATSATARNVQGAYAKDNQTTSVAGRTGVTTQCIRITNDASTVLLAADFVSMDADGFTLNWATVISGADVHYLALAGTELTNMLAGSYNAINATGNQAITGAGFQPTFMFIEQSRNTAAYTSASHAYFSVGAALSTSKRWGLTGTFISVSAAANSYRALYTNQCIVDVSSANSINALADFVSFDSDGFTINWSDAEGNTNIGFYLALKGLSVDVGTITTPAGTGNQATTGIGFKPSAIMLFGVNTSTTGSIVDDQNLSMGAASGTTQRAAIWVGDDDAADPMVSKSGSRTDLVYAAYSPQDQSLTAAADLVSFDADGFTLNWTTTPGSGQVIGYVAFGPGAASATSYLPIDRKVRRNTLLRM